MTAQRPAWRPMRPVVLRAAGYPHRWLDDLADRVDGPEDYERAWAREADAVAARFQADPTLRDALLVSNDASHAPLGRWLDRFSPGKGAWPKDDRQKLDTLVRYLQRVCAKNDTTSHLGTLAVGRLDPGEPRPASSRPAPLRRVTLLARWAADALAERMGEDPRLWPGLRPRPSPGAAVEGHTLEVARFDYRTRTSELGRAVRFEPDHVLEPAEELLLRSVTGGRTVAELARLAGLPVAETMGRLRELERLGAVVCGPEIPYGAADPLAWLRSQLDEPDLWEWARTLDGLSDLLRGLACAAPAERPRALDELKQRFEAVARVPAERGRRGFYSDRMVFTEECEGPVADLRVGAPVIETIAGDLGIACDLYLVGPRWRLWAERELQARWLERRFPGRREVPVVRYLRAYLDDLPDLEREYARVDARVGAIWAELERSLVPEGAWARPAVELAPARVAAAVAAAACPDPAMPAVCNPDLMLARGDGGLLAVVGEIHLGEENLTHGMFAPFVARTVPGFTEEAVACYRALLEEDEELVDVALHHRNKTFVRSALPCPDVEACDRSPGPRSAVVPLHRLTVCPSPAGPRLRAPGFERFLRPLTLPLAWLGLPHNPFHAFGFPQHEGRSVLCGAGLPHAPRLVIGRVAVQREQWRVPAAALAGDRREGFFRAQAVRRERGLPRRVFVRTPGEPKPVYCDLDSPLLVRHLTRMATGAGGGDVALSEMLPEPERLWLELDGRRYTSELRLALFRSRTGGPAVDPAAVTRAGA